MTKDKANPSDPKSLKSKQPQGTLSSSGKEELEKDNPFVLMGVMLKSSLGRLPTGLVWVLCLSIGLSLIAGLSMKFARHSKLENSPSILRLEPSGKKMELAKVQGIWLIQTDEYSMSMNIIGNKYEWIIYLPDKKSVRYFSRGTVTVNSDVMILEQRSDQGYSYDKNKLWIQYLPISMQNINIRFDVEKRRMGWNVSVSETGQLMGPIAGLFRDLAGKNLIWTKR
ncbi:MAG: hypothetical protein KDJ26_07490 [Alphaproteobacteria bacterium]|nr:hypothetical protein [Alphaproteobacteria bacterium]MCB1551825.1 hypothetical protein [Alphaproteobacteria bacterium]MCB9984160.1 hypothetical protein [Micavibrio sp.]HPQ50947.1 hypothetical protein [Alphaproteobacteria bacterium]HRK97007.1 hypothetical protein [Alphaproteobacteria bacterium]